LIKKSVSKQMEKHPSLLRMVKFLAKIQVLFFWT
jgi:hypothetical protein